MTRYRDRLRAADLDTFTGAHIPHNHVELHLAAMRPERSSGFKQRNGIVVDSAFIAATTERIRAFAAASTAKTLFFSAEGLSLLRNPDELATLKTLLPDGTAQIVVALREPTGFLASYARQLGPAATTDPADRDSHAYVAPDSWLADYAPRLALWRAAFGAENVTVLDYDAALREDGSILPRFLDAIGLGGVFTPEELQVPFENRSEDSLSPAGRGLG